MTRMMRAALACGVAAAIAACGGGGGGSKTGGGDPPTTVVLSATAVTIPATQAGAALPAAQVVTVSNAGIGALPWPTATVAADGAWLDAAVAESAGGYAVSLRPNTTALAPTTHTTTVQIAAAGAVNSPASVTVSWSITGSGGGGSTATAGDGVRAFANAMLDRYTACFKTTAAFRAMLAAGRDDKAAAADAAVAAGRMTYRQADADACVAWVASATCVAIGDEAYPASCAFLTGHVANTGSCRDSEECANGYCAYANSCPGTCTAFKAEGAQCNGDEACGPGHACPHGFCAPRTAPGAADGQPCGDGEPRCVSGLYCDNAATPICRAYGQEGAGCTGSQTCAPGLGCASDGAGGSRCTAFVGEGQSCATAPCGSGALCASDTKKCVAFATVGQSCANTICLGGTHCIGATSPVCVAGTVGLGATCTDYHEHGAASDPSTLCNGAAAGASGNRYVRCTTVPGQSTTTCALAIFTCY